LLTLCLGSKVRVLGLGLVEGLGLALINSHMSRKSRTVSYLALGRIWHDTGNLNLHQIRWVPVEQY